MTPILALTLAAVFVCIAVTAGLVTSRALSWAGPERKRLRTLTAAAATAGAATPELPLAETPVASIGRLSTVLPKSPKDMSRLRRQLAAAGRYDLRAAVYYSVGKIAVPIVLAVIPLLVLNVRDGWLMALVAGVVGFVLPDLVLTRKIKAHHKAIQNGLPDALDLLIVCIEAGSSLDQSVVKASEELDVAHPRLAEELRILTAEVRAGKPRVEAFRNLGARTRVDDVKSLVTMLIQTDRFGTSIAQALRVHADTSRTKRRQRAEERAHKVGVKLVFPLVLCIFPAVYVVCLGPAVIAIYNAFV